MSTKHERAELATFFKHGFRTRFRTIERDRFVAIFQTVSRPRPTPTPAICLVGRTPRNSIFDRDNSDVGTVPRYRYSRGPTTIETNNNNK